MPARTIPRANHPSMEALAGVRPGKSRHARKLQPLQILSPANPVPDKEAGVVRGFQREAHVLDADLTKTCVAFASGFEGVDIQRPSSDRQQ